MVKLEKETFICIDCETTGLDPVNDQIIEVAVVAFTTERVLEDFDTLVDPGIPIPPSSTDIHHITDDMVRGKPKIQDVVSEVIRIAGNNIIIGHGIWFDVEMVALAADRFGISHALRQNKQADTLRMARFYGESPVNSLEVLRKHFNIQPEGAHRAMSDVMVNVEVFKYLLKQYRSTEHLFDVLSRPITIKIMPLGKHKGRPIKDLPLDYLLHAANRDFDKDLLYSIRSEINRRKKGNLFTQAGNPFQGL